MKKNLIGLFGEKQKIDDAFFSDALRFAGSVSVKLTEETAFPADKIVLLAFALKGLGSCRELTVTLNGREEKQMTYFIPVQWTRLYLPVLPEMYHSVTLESSGEILLAEAAAESTDTADFSSLALKSGQWLLEPFEKIELDEKKSGLGVGPSKDMVRSGEYIYCIGSDKFSVLHTAADGSCAVTGSISGLGREIRQIALLYTGQDVIITSRQNGAYIVNVADPAHPYVRSQYDSLEMATGLCVSDRYAYICNRQYGVEIIDLSDPDKPRHLAAVKTGTVQSCLVYDGMLFCGLWNERRVDLYDVTRPDHAFAVAKLPLSGKGDGLTVAKIGGKTLLYAATGQHAAKSVSDAGSDLSDLDFGQGNGLDIYDVTDPAHAVRLSVSRIDGRYYFARNDYWKAQVAITPDGRVYAYLVSTYNGIYVYDVTDPCAPIRLTQITIPIYPDSKQYEMQDFPGRATVFNYDQRERIQSPVGAIICEDGDLYLAAAFTDIHRAHLEKLIFRSLPVQNTTPLLPSDGSYYALSEPLPNMRFYKPDGQAYAVIRIGGYYYAACGNAGVLVLDDDLNFIAKLKTDGCAMDVREKDGLLYIAAKDAGLCVYRLSEDGMSVAPEWQYRSEFGVTRQVRLSPGGRYALIQTGAEYAEVINCASHTRQSYRQSLSQLYHHSLLNEPVAGRYLAIIAECEAAFWVDFGENDSLQEPVWFRDYPYNMTGMQSGATALGNLCLTVTPNGYVLYDPATTETLNAPKQPVYRDPACAFSGKPTVSGDLLAVCDRIYGGHVWLIDIKDRAHPKVLRDIRFKGNPDFALIEKEAVVVPLGYQGIIKFNR